MNRAFDSVVGPAPADVRRHELADLRVSGVRSLRQQRCRGHDLPALAIAALRHVFDDPGFLQRMKLVRIQAFDGCDVLARDAGDRRHAGVREFAIDVNAARAAKSGATAEFGASEAKRVAEHPQ